MDEAVAGAAVDLVRTYLRWVEARDLDAASTLLDDDVTITFPGGREFHSLGDQVASSGARFRSVRKTFDHFDTFGNSIPNSQLVDLVGKTLR